MEGTTTDLYSLPKDILIALFTSLEEDVTQRVTKKLKKEMGLLEFQANHCRCENTILTCAVEDCPAKQIVAGRGLRYPEIEHCSKMFECKKCRQEFCDRHIGCQERELCHNCMEEKHKD
jgi:hypothetical protein